MPGNCVQETHADRPASCMQIDRPASCMQIVQKFMQIVKHWMSILPECSLGHGNREKIRWLISYPINNKEKYIVSQKCFDHTEYYVIFIWLFLLVEFVRLSCVRNFGLGFGFINMAVENLAVEILIISINFIKSNW